MDSIIYVKYGELTLKGKNKKDFINTLFQNVKKALKDFENIKIVKEFDNIKIFDCHQELNAIVNILCSIPGIEWVIPASLIPRDIDTLKDITFNYMNEGESFRIDCRRKDKSFFLKSTQITSIVAGNILSNKKYTKVNLHTPDKKISIEVNNDHFIVYETKLKGCGGFPVGVNKRALVLISGGIDSPVAGHLMQKKGCVVDYITFITPPYTTPESLEKTMDLIRVITLNGRIQNSRLFVINFTPILQELNHIENESYKITLMRRSFFRIARRIAGMIDAKAIVTGESIGQVASQTMESMETISSAVKDILIYRPLLTLDKKEIIDIAKDINTYEISIKPYSDSCSIFAPKKPVTKPNVRKAEEYESKLEYLSLLEESVIKNIKDIYEK